MVASILLTLNVSLKVQFTGSNSGPLQGGHTPYALPLRNRSNTAISTLRKLELDTVLYGNKKPRAALKGHVLSDPKRVNCSLTYEIVFWLFSSYGKFYLSSRAELPPIYEHLCRTSHLITFLISINFLSESQNIIIVYTHFWCLLPGKTPRLIFCIISVTDHIKSR